VVGGVAATQNSRLRKTRCFGLIADQASALARLMNPRPKTPPPGKSTLHPRNRHRTSYDFRQLVAGCPSLAQFVGPAPHGGESIDFADPAAVRALNQALLRHFYGVAKWDLPAGYLCPPVPGRADYVHHAADLLRDGLGGVIPRGPSVAVLDVGVGASCIYPIIGRHEYGWRFVGSEIDPMALRSAQEIVAANPLLSGPVECRRQTEGSSIFQGVIRPGEFFALSLCNPPFHASAAEAAAGNRRKVGNLTGQRGPRPVLNFGGKGHELWCAGGELGFVRRMIAESAQFSERCLWFTSLVARSDHLPALRRALQSVGALEVRTVEMAQGQKRSRLLAWTFLAPAQRRSWMAAHGG